MPGNDDESPLEDLARMLHDLGGTDRPRVDIIIFNRSLEATLKAISGPVPEQGYSRPFMSTPGPRISMPRMSSVRRLCLEAHTLAMSELKRSIDAPSDEARPLNNISLRLKGLNKVL